ncbi:MAG: mitochondrial K+-H+ exchange-related-domain-containing protein [Benniella sp.]|nr:MAG: mitochondrial K+-H+ exchange-related-domain-containing protein [Benniella sp.]
MRLFMIPLSRTASMMHCHSTHTPSSASYLNRSTAWAGNKWEGLSAAKPETMKYKLHGAGSRMLEKLEHQEIFLKEVPPKEDMTITTMVPFLYPSSLKEPQVQAEFEALLKQRIPYHRKNMMYSASCVPVTSLFTLVPFVPNIPLFYNAFRLWSHWKAYHGAKHLEILLKNGSITFQPSDVLNLGLPHDPEFAVFFTESNQLSVRRRQQRKYQQQDPNAPVIAESSGEVTPTLNHDKTLKSASTTDQDSSAAHDATTTATTLTTTKAQKADDDPMSITDHVVHEGFLSDEEIGAICRAFENPPMMSREIKRARFQEAEKFVKAKLKSARTMNKNGDGDRPKLK